MKKFLLFTLTALWAGVWGSYAQAGVVFEHDFENVPLNSAIGLPANANTPSVGTWFRGAAKIDTVSPATGGGLQYLNPSRALLQDEAFGALSVPATNIGDVVRVEMLIRVGNQHPQFGLLNKTGPGVTGSTLTTDATIFLTLFNPGSIRSTVGVTHNVIGGIDFAADQWQAWAIDYTVGDTSFDLTVDGTTVTVTDMMNPGDPVAGVFFKGGSGTSDYDIDNIFVTVDQIPEPASLLLFGIAGLGIMLTRRW